MADEQRDPIGAPQPAPEPRMWNLGDVLLITMMFIIPVVVLEMFFGNRPIAMLFVQALSYAISLLCARVIISLKTGKGFFESIEWNYPGATRLPQLLLLGLLVSAAVLLFTTIALPIPPKLPVEKLFSTRVSAIVTMTFATLVAPIAEEIYFRGIFFGAVRSALEEEHSRRALGLLMLILSAGFFFIAWRGNGSSFALFAPVLLAVGLLLFPFRAERAPLLDEERRTLIALMVTATYFALVHGAQLAHSWGPLLGMFVAGIVFTIVRVRLRSVAASWLVHTGYNGTIFLVSWVQTSGFHKLS